MNRTIIITNITTTSITAHTVTAITPTTYTAMKRGSSRAILIGSSIGISIALRVRRDRAISLSRIDPRPPSVAAVNHDLNCLPLAARPPPGLI